MKHLLPITLGLFGLALLPSCKNYDGDDRVVPTECTDIHWTYEGAEGPAHWDDLCLGYSACAGSSQSPINIEQPTADASLAAIVKNYHATATHILNNGHTEQVNYDAGSDITVNGETYSLLQFHFHTPSEHTVNGVSYPMEVHLVHKNASTGKLAVIGILFEEGAENELLKKFITHLPANKDQTYESTDSYDVAELLPSGNGYYTYAGSLTTPPCSEIVTWLVLKDHITASVEQIHAIEALEQENNRPIQNRYGRTIRSFN
ncbi:MAG: carbonic anhydrase family protein [Saprospiraceae bacterium]